MKPSHNLDMGFETKKLADRSSLDVAAMCGTKSDWENTRGTIISQICPFERFTNTVSRTHQSLVIRNVNVCNRTEL